MPIYSPACSPRSRRAASLRSCRSPQSTRSNPARLERQGEACVYAVFVDAANRLADGRKSDAYLGFARFFDATARSKLRQNRKCLRLRPANDTTYTWCLTAVLSMRNPGYDHELRWLTAGILEPMDFAQLNRHGVAFFDRGGFAPPRPPPTVAVPEPSRIQPASRRVKLIHR